LTIAGFAGLRTAEITRLDWREVDLQERMITVASTKAKTGSRRIVPIADNLLNWLKPVAQSQGAVVPFRSWWNELAAVADRASVIREESEPNFTWRRNALRHSFCSYKLALCGDVARVSYEAGNSPQMVHRHYKALVNEKQGTEWFNINPSSLKPLQFLRPR
jgi:integrase